MSKTTGWATSTTLRAKLKKKWVQGAFLANSVGRPHTTEFPLRISIKGPTSAEMADQFPLLREWIANLRNDTEERHPGLSLEWKDVNHRTMGQNQYPIALVVADIDGLAAFLGVSRELHTFRSLVTAIKSRIPKLVSWASAYPFELIANEDALDRLLDITDWLLHHPRPQIYIRELSLPGVDTKFIEGHKKALMHILDTALPDGSVDNTCRGVRYFEARYGFRKPPQLVRFRLTEGSDFFGGCSDLSIPSEEFAALPEGFVAGIDTVYVVENDITALAFPLEKRAMVIFGRGYDFSNLSQASWLIHKRLYYWGDIDTHGFAILSQFRGYFPSTSSILMDQETLENHRDQWVLEGSPVKGELPNLSRAEALLFRGLRDNILGDNVRLEQEFIHFEAVKNAVLSQQTDQSGN